MTWEELCKKYNQPNTSNIEITLLGYIYLVCENDGSVIIRHGDRFESLLCLAVNRTPDEMDEIIKSLTRERLTWTDLKKKYRKQFPHFKIQEKDNDVIIELNKGIKLLVDGRTPEQMDKLLQKLKGE